MTLATKNGSIIVKDGKLAENCGCCGGWYCCTNASDACATAQRVSSVAVAISGGQNRRYETSEEYQVCYQGTGTPGFVYTRYLGITPTSHYTGAFSLSRVSDTRWQYQYPQDAAGCNASLTVDITAPYGWVLTLAYNYYGWQKISRSAIATSKQFADMKCATQVVSPFVLCYTQPFERYIGAQDAIVISSAETFDCGPTPVNKTFQRALTVYSGGASFDEKGPPPGYASSVISSEGTATVSINLAITPA